MLYNFFNLFSLYFLHFNFDLTIVLIGAEVIRSVDVMKGRRPAVMGPNLVGPRAQAAEVIISRCRQKLGHGVCCGFAQPRLQQKKSLLG